METQRFVFRFTQWERALSMQYMVSHWAFSGILFWLAASIVAALDVNASKIVSRHCEGAGFTIDLGRNHTA